MLCGTCAEDRASSRLRFPGLQIVHVSGDETVYDGPYEVATSIDPQTLAVKGLLMASDITVNPIHTQTVENTAHGLTVTIGGN